MTIANVLTLSRVALIPVFGWLWAAGHYAGALVVYGIAGVSDALDGFLARMLEQPSRLGAILDPAADKLMLLVSFLVAANTGAVPWWLAGLVIGRDALLSAGAGLMALAFRSRGFSLRIHPTRIGKYSTFFQLTTILAALVVRAARVDSVGERWIAALIYVTGAFTVVAGLQYMGGALLSLLGSPAGVRPPRTAPSRSAP